MVGRTDERFIGMAATMLLFKHERKVGHCTRQTWRKIPPSLWDSTSYVPFPKQHASFTNDFQSFRWNFFQRFLFPSPVVSSHFWLFHTLAPRPFKLSLVVFPVYWLIKLTRTNLANIYKPLGARYDRRYKYRSSISQAVSYARCKRRGAVFVNRRLRSRGVSWLADDATVPWRFTGNRLTFAKKLSSVPSPPPGLECRYFIGEARAS